jgi:SAM-dependent methyltransferase
MSPGERACPACGRAAAREPSVRVEGVPILLNVLVSDPEVARAAPRGNLELHGCDGCGLIWNAAFAGVPYDPSYQVDASLSPRYAAHLDEVAERIAALEGGAGPVRVVEIGCGQGVFLGVLARRLGARLVAAHGFDPAFRGDTSHLPPGTRVTRAELSYASVADLDFAPNLVVARHTIEHVADPVGLLRTLHQLLLPRGPFTLVIETPDAGWTLARGLLHDLCYEHCSLCSRGALEAALERAGYGSTHVESAFSGEYLFATANAAPGDASPIAEAKPAILRANVGTGAALRALGERFAREHAARLERAERPIAVWGGAGKGALFALLADPTRRLIDCVIDIHPDKRGTFLPGSALAVVSPEEARARGVRTIVVANANYAAEIRARCRAEGWDASISTVG